MKYKKMKLNTRFYNNWKEYTNKEFNKINFLSVLIIKNYIYRKTLFIIDFFNFGIEFYL